MRTQPTQSDASRSGFTLLELLIVVSIIATLMSLSFYVMNGITEGAEKEATTTTIHKINRLLEQRIEAFDRAFKGSRRNSYVQATVGLLATNTHGRFDYFRVHPEDAPPAIVILAKKAGFRYEFPQRMVERTAIGEDINSNGLLDPSEDLEVNGIKNGILDGPDNVPIGAAFPGLTVGQTGSLPGMPFSIYERIASPVALQQLIQEGNPAPTELLVNQRVSLNWSKHQPETESAELLYYTLVAAGSFGSSSVDADQFSNVEIKDTDDDGLPEFVDVWSQPLRYYRWPTRLIDPTAPNPFQPNFATFNDNTEVDLTPELLIDDESDGLREVTPSERLHASLLIRGLPATPVPYGGLPAQRDLLLVDPDDPVGLLYSFIEDPNYKTLGVDLTLEINEAKYHTLDTYHAPLIVSAGPDELLGLREPFETDASLGIYGNLGQYEGTTALPGFQQPSSAVVDKLFDNLTNRNRRVGAKR